MPKVGGYSVLHEGFVGVFGDGGVQELTYAKLDKETGKAAGYKGAGGWLGFTDKYWAFGDHSGPDGADRSALHRRSATSSPRTIRPTSSARRRRSRPAPDGRGDDADLRRRQGSQHDRQLPDHARHQEVRPDDRLGLVLFHHQAPLPADRRDLSRGRQFRRRDPDRDGARQARLLPARQPLLSVDGEDEEDPAADRRAQGSLSRRQG